jgi:integrative and conjugative element protein (TIGR02256 family)
MDNSRVRPSPRVREPQVSGRAWMLTTALSAMRVEVACHLEQETGGLLLGYANGEDLVIADIVGSGPNARRTKHTFLPDDEWQTDELAKAYRASGRIHTYLGDWHTHPSGGGELSWRDLRTLKHIAHTAKARVPRPVSLVLVPAPDEIIAVWRMNGRLRKLERMQVTLLARTTVGGGKRATSADIGKPEGFGSTV